MLPFDIIFQVLKLIDRIKKKKRKKEKENC